MAAQNIYDDPEFLAGYMTLDRQVDGLDGAAEWPDLQSLLPGLRARRVVDLGCGAGWFSRYAVEHGSRSVIGFDVSTRMLEIAQSLTTDGAVDYRCADLDELELPADSADLVFSSLTLHYVLDLERLLTTIAQTLVPSGSLVFSVEHPMYSASTRQQFLDDSDAGRVWPVNNYLDEGERVTSWFVDGVVKQHRTTATYVNTVVNSGLVIDRLIEWGPTVDQVAARPELQDDRHRPWFLLVACHHAGQTPDDDS